MLGVRYGGRTLFWIACVVFLLGATSVPVSGEITGDPELLATVAKKYRENLDHIRFLTGRVKQRSLSLDPTNADKSYASEYTIDYACDATNSKYWYRATTDKNNFADGRPIPNVGLMVYSAVRLGDDWFEHSYDPGVKNRRSALQFAPPARLGCWTYHRFDPKLMYTDSGEFRDVQFQYLRDHFKDPAYAGSVIQIGDDIIFEQVDQTGTFRTKTVYSLRYGGNATRLTTSIRTADLVEEDSIEWEWQLMNGVFVPKRAHMAVNTSGKDAPALNQETTYEWQEQRVNESPAAEVFSLANIGLREGDSIRENDKQVRLLKAADLLAPSDGSAKAFETTQSQPAESASETKCVCRE